MQVTSQHPYAEQFIGEPHVYTIDIKNLTLVRETIEQILRKNTVSNIWSKWIELNWTALQIAMSTYTGDNFRFSPAFKMNCNIVKITGISQLGQSSL